MKTIRKISAVLLVLTLLLVPCMTGMTAAGEEALPTTNTTLDFVNDYANAVSLAAEQYKVFQYDNGMLASKPPQSYIVYEVDENSPVVAYFKLMTTKGEEPAFYVSADGSAWSSFTMTVRQNGEQNRWYYTDGIGAGKRYVKIVICAGAISEVWRSDLMSLSFNGSGSPAMVTDTTLNFLTDYSGAISAAYRTSSDLLQVYEGGLSGNDTPGSFIVFQVENNSPIKARMKLFTDLTSARPEFYASSDAETWAKLSPAFSREEGNPNFTDFVISGIGEGNKYLKIVISNQALGAPWYIDLTELSFVASTEREELPTPDTEYDFVNHYDAALADSYQHSSDLTHIWQGGMGGTNAPDSYVVYQVEENSPVVATFKLFAGDTQGRPRFYASSDGKNWAPLTMKTDQEIAGTLLVRYYTAGIGADNCYIKVVISDRALSLVYYSDLQALAFNAAEVVPEFDTTLDFVNDFDNAYAKVISANAVVQHSGLIGSGDISEGYIILKMQKNSPFSAFFQFFPGQFSVSTSSPMFYASEDGFCWKQITVSATQDGNYRSFYKKSIGEKNRYLKIVINSINGPVWASKIMTVSYVANTEPNPGYSRTLNFLTDYNGSLLKSADHGGLFGNTGQNGLTAAQNQTGFVVYEVERGSAISADFLIFDYAASSQPVFYASPDGVNWKTMLMERSANGDRKHYYKDSIGAKNRYVKIRINNVNEPTFWANDLRSFSYNLVDPSDNGRVDADDTVLFRKKLLGVQNVSGIDFNGDGSEDIRDLVCIKKYLATSGVGFDENLPDAITNSPNLDYSGKTVGVLTPNEKPAYYNNLLNTLRTGINAEVVEIPWENVTTALDASKVEAVVIPSVGTVPYGTETALSRYLGNGGKLLTLGGVPFETSLYPLNGQWLEAYDFMEADAKEKGKYTVSTFDSTGDLSKWGRNAYSGSGSQVKQIVDNGSPTGTNCVHVNLNNFTAWDMMYCSLPVRGYKSLAFWAKGSDSTKSLSIEMRETDGARWYANIDLTDEWSYYVLGPGDFSYWPWDSSAVGRGQAGDALRMESAAMVQIGLSGSFSPVADGNKEFWLDDVCLLNYEKPVETTLVLEGLSPEWKYYPITNGNSVRVSDSQVFVGDRNYVLPDDAVSINSGTQGIGYGSGKQTRFVPLIEIFDSKNLFSGCLAWMNINSSYATDRRSNGSITACFGTDDPAFYNADGLAAVLDTVHTMLNDSLFTEAGTDEYIYVESETKNLKTGGYVRGKSLHGVTMEIDWVQNGKRISSESFEMEYADHIREYAGTVLNMIGVDYSLSSGKPDSVIITLKKDGTPVDRIVQEIKYWSPKPMSERKYITKQNGEFYRDGSPLRLYGVNFMPNIAAIGFDAASDAAQSYHEQWWYDCAYDPEKIYRQLQRAKEIGFNAVSVNAYIQEAEDGLNLLHFINMCDEMGLYVDCYLAGADGVTTNGGAAKRIIELQHLAELDNIVAYDIAWERTLGYYESSYSNQNGRKVLDAKWVDWVIRNYGSVAAAENLWHESMPRNSSGAYVGPSDAMLCATAPSAMVAAYRRFADEYLVSNYDAVISLLKQSDPYHLFSSRAGAASGTPMYSPGNMVFDAQGLAAIYDFYSPEFYDEGQGFDKRDFNFVNLYAQFAMPESPVVWKEFGERVWEGSNFLSPTEHVKYSAALSRQAATVTAMLDAALTTHATAIYTWCLQPGLRVDEGSDCGIFNPDGSDRPVTKVFREYRERFMNQPMRGDADVKITVDRDLSASGWKEMYASIKDDLLQYLAEGKTVALVDAATGKTTANVSDESVGGCGSASGVNPARYVGGTFRSVEIQGSDGVWKTVSNGAKIVLPSGKVRMRVVAQNTQHSEWITSGTGAVSIASGTSSDIQFSHVLSGNVPYLESTLEEFVLVDNFDGQAKNISIRFNVSGRFDFGTPIEFTISAQ